MASELAASQMIPDNHLLLDQPLLKVPFELARKNFKASQRQIEHEQKTLLASIKAAAAAAVKQSNSEPALAALDTMITRMENLKRKLETLHEEEKQIHRQSRARIEHLADLHAIQNVADVKYDEWAKVRLNRLLVDYLVRTGYGESARKFAKENGVEDLVDVDAFWQCHQIKTSLEQGRTTECLAWCAENKQTLKKINSTLEYELRLQQYIELVRHGHMNKSSSEYLKAITHAQKHLTTAPSSTPSTIQVANLLIFPHNTWVEPYTTKYSKDRWAFLADLFVNTHHEVYSLPTKPALLVALSAGLSALKTPACHSQHLSSSSNANTSSGTSVCPICSTELNELARSVPYAHHSSSMVENDPVVLPNGRIYGRERLMNFQKKVHDAGPGKIRDPTEPQRVFDESQVMKVYIS